MNQLHPRDPDGVLTAQRSCYLGREGGGGSCGCTSVTEDGVEFTAANLLPGEGMTIANSVNRTRVEEVVLERLPTFWFWTVGLFLCFFGLIYFVYRYRTRFRTGNPIIPQYEPYEGVKPMYTGLLFDGRLDPRDITAGIVYLAEQGFLKIGKTKTKVLFFFEVDDYEITL